MLVASEPFITEAAVRMFAERGARVSAEDFLAFTGTPRRASAYRSDARDGPRDAALAQRPPMPTLARAWTDTSI